MLAASQSNPFFIATDGINVYWTNVGNGPPTANDGTVMKCAVGGCGGAPTTIASAQSGPSGIAVDGTSVYWADYSGNAIMKFTPK